MFEVEFCRCPIAVMGVLDTLAQVQRSQPKLVIEESYHSNFCRQCPMFSVQTSHLNSKNVAKFKAIH
mgnify:CR=1 FL=1